MSRHRSQKQRILAILMLLGLLFQVQTVLACQMLGTSVPAERCCCDHAEPSKNASDQHAEDDCCELDTELSLKEPDLEKTQLALVQSSPALDLPEAVAVILIVAIWHDELSDSALQASWAASPLSALSGSKTYLSTQRLRI